MKTVLFPTDFSKNAQHAFHFAKMITSSHNGKLILFHTYQLPIVAPSNIFISREDTLKMVNKDFREAANQHMKLYTDELELSDINYEIVLKEGNSVDEISDYVKKKEVDLIVMGTKGKTNDRDLLIGSITARLLRNTNIPVLAVPQSAKRSSFTKMVYATDLTYNSINELELIIRFAKANEAELTFLYIDTEGTKDLKEIDELKKIIKLHERQTIDFQMVKANEVKDGIDYYLNENKVDLLILSNHTKSLYERLFHKSISKQMILHSKIPLLIFSKEIHPVVFF